MLATCLAIFVSGMQLLTPKSNDASGGPYCGVYCVYAASQMLGKNFAFQDLLSGKYISSHLGSSVSELQAAIQERGLFATPMNGLTLSSLRASKYPMILHVRKPGFGMPFNHWILYCGEQNNQARIIDPPSSLEHMPYAELLSYWDGSGIIISNEPMNTTAFQFPVWLESLAMFLGLFTILILIRSIQQQTTCFGMAILLFSTSALFGIVNHLLSSEGLFSNPVACGLVAQQHFQADIPIIDRQDLQPLFNRSDVTIIDSRIPMNYHEGHLPGAINLPVNAGFQQRRGFCKEISLENQIVVYCQSANCTWADAIAGDLYHRGYRNISIYRNGWYGWVNHE
jgi:rhodanese-related sulfurtransferase